MSFVEFLMDAYEYLRDGELDRIPDSFGSSPV